MRLINESTLQIKNIISFLLKNLPNGFNYGRLLDLRVVKEVAKNDVDLYNLLMITISGNVADTEKEDSLLENTIQKYGIFIPTFSNS